jgi:hypothetical protein
MASSLTSFILLMKQNASKPGKVTEQLEKTLDKMFKHYPPSGL